jgi:rhodanese-related sulfurtransferase
MKTMKIKSRTAHFLGAWILIANISCAAQPDNVLAPKDFKSKMAQPSVTVLDVRTPEEFKSGHLEKATNINVNDSAFESQSAKLDKAKPILVYCKAGIRSKKAADMLRAKGYQVHELKGGLDEWQNAGLPVVKE